MFVTYGTPYHVPYSVLRTICRYCTVLTVLVVLRTGLTVLYRRYWCHQSSRLRSSNSFFISFRCPSRPGHLILIVLPNPHQRLQIPAESPHAPLLTTSSQRLSILFPASHFLRIDFAPRSFSLTFRSSPHRHILSQRCPIVFDELHFLLTAPKVISNK